MCRLQNSIGFFVTILVVIISCEGRSVAPLGDATNLNYKATHLLKTDADDLTHYGEEAHSEDVKRGKRGNFGSDLFGFVGDTFSGVAGVSSQVDSIAPNPITGLVTFGAGTASAVSKGFSNLFG